jgi:preprotein translocase subunit YajC
MTLQDLAFFAVLALGLYLLMIRPQRNRAKALSAVRSGLTVGSRVMTTAGIHATVLEVGEDRETVLLEIAPGVPVRFASAAVVRILEPAVLPPDPA